MSFELRYTPGTRYGDAFPSWRFGQRHTFEAADATRMQCAHPDSIEVVPVEIDSVNKGIRETMVDSRTAPRRCVNTADSGGLDQHPSEGKCQP